MKSQVIFGADDFGRSSHINEAVELAHRQGVLTSASLMVNGDAFREAVAISHRLTDLAVGLHLVVLDGRTTLPPRDLPHLVDAEGLLPPAPLRLGLRYAFHRPSRRELEAEMEAQFERFAATGLPLSHVDGHWHMHMHPTVFDSMIRLAETYGARGIRIPRDPVLPALRVDRRRGATKLAWAFTYALLSRRGIGRLRGSRLVFADRVFGLMQTGAMSEEYVLSILRRLSVPTAELYFHPASEPSQEPLGPNPGDLRTLLSPAVRRAVEEGGLQLATYPSLMRRQA